MARGQRKSLTDKIEEKKNTIECLKSRIEKEKAELEELINEQKQIELDSLYSLIKTSGISIEQIEQYVTEQIQCTA